MQTIAIAIFPRQLQFHVGRKKLPGKSIGVKFLATGWQNRHFHTGMVPYDRWPIFLSNLFQHRHPQPPNSKQNKEKEVPKSRNLSHTSSQQPIACHLDLTTKKFKKNIPRKIHVKKTSTKINVEKMRMIIAICTSGIAGAIKLAYIFPEEGHLWKPTGEAT